MVVFSRFPNRWEGGHMKDPAPYYGQHPEDAEDPAFAWADKWYMAESTDMAGMNQNEQEEWLLSFGSRKERKAIKERRKAREKAQK
jgi:hypothetical protein